MGRATEAVRHAEAVAEFNARNSPEGLFRRYCRGRVLRLPMRLGFGLVGAAAFALLADPWIGLLAAGAYATGELIEMLVLSALLQRPGGYRGGGGIRAAARGAATLAAACHALCTSAAVALLTMAGGFGEAGGLAAVLIAGAAIDGGVTFRFFGHGAIVRLAIHGIAFVGLSAYAFWLQPLPESLGGANGFDLASGLLLAAVVAMIIRFTARMHDRKVEDAHRILAEQERLDVAQAALERAVAESRRLALVARHATDAVIIYGADGRVDWVNETFTRTTGFTPEDIVGRLIEEVIPTPDPSQPSLRALNRARRARRPCRAQFRVREKAGREIWLETILTPIADGGGGAPVMIAVERDVTAAKAREVELARPG